MVAPDLAASSVAPGSRAAAVERARRLNVATIGWNGLGGVVAVAADLAAGSVSLVGFGVDSAIEVSTALVLTWRLRQERRAACTQRYDATATRWIALCSSAWRPTPPSAGGGRSRWTTRAARSEPHDPRSGLLRGWCSSSTSPR
ncbi:MAG TPA: hypothetical protein VM933_09190 [Acidimicrobiales bacterium]|nr:hypothetical protein [Acidimicrobiales bacterium]